MIILSSKKKGTKLLYVRFHIYTTLMGMYIFCTDHGSLIHFIKFYQFIILNRIQSLKFRLIKMHYMYNIYFCIFIILYICIHNLSDHRSFCCIFQIQTYDNEYSDLVEYFYFTKYLSVFRIYLEALLKMLLTKFVPNSTIIKSNFSDFFVILIINQHQI